MKTGAHVILVPLTYVLCLLFGGGCAWVLHQLAGTNDLEDWSYDPSRGWKPATNAVVQPPPPPPLPTMPPGARYEAPMRGITHTESAGPGPLGLTFTSEVCSGAGLVIWRLQGADQPNGPWTEVMSVPFTNYFWLPLTNRAPQKFFRVERVL